MKKERENRAVSGGKFQVIKTKIKEKKSSTFHYCQLSHLTGADSKGYLVMFFPLANLGGGKNGK